MFICLMAPRCRVVAWPLGKEQQSGVRRSQIIDQKRSSFHERFAAFFYQRDWFSFAFFFFNLVDQMSGLKTYGKIGGKLVESARIIDPKIDAKCRNKVDGGGGGVDSENWFDLTEN